MAVHAGTTRVPAGPGGSLHSAVLSWICSSGWVTASLGCPGRDGAALEGYSESSLPPLTSGAACPHSQGYLWRCFSLSPGCVQVAKGLILHGAEHSLFLERWESERLSGFHWIRPGFDSLREFLCKSFAGSMIPQLTRASCASFIMLGQRPKKTVIVINDNCFVLFPELLWDVPAPLRCAKR